MASPSTKKRPPLEMEPGEGKAHEMAETPEEEKNEGPEPDDGPKAKSRKRSPKGAKNTKAPMDAEACCSNCAEGKPCKGKAMKDGGCGSSMKDCATCTKRNDSLTPQEYLAACELGIQNRHRCYIRARLDVAERFDKKCGASGIADNKKCNKGQASAVHNNGKPLSNRQVRQIERGILAQEAATGKSSKLSPEQVGLLIQTPGTNSRKYYAAQFAKAKSSSMKEAINRTKGSTDPIDKAMRRLAKRELFNRRVSTAAGAAAIGGALAFNALTRRRDSVWAEGFEA